MSTVFRLEQIVGLDRLLTQLEMRKFKRVMDPNGILSPGKIF